MCSEYLFLKLFGVDLVVLMWELMWIYYLGLKLSGVMCMIDGQIVMQVLQIGYLLWLNNGLVVGYLIGMVQGMLSLVGVMIDFNWIYDGLLIFGWQVMLGVMFLIGLYGYMFIFIVNYVQGVKLLNVYVLFNQNLLNWQVGINFILFWGGYNMVGQFYVDCNFVGLFVMWNF